MRQFFTYWEICPYQNTSFCQQALHFPLFPQLECTEKKLKLEKVMRIALVKHTRGVWEHCAATVMSF